MRTALLLLILIAVAPVASAQQTDCRDGVPCGGVPWSMPVLPRLVSPTPINPSAATTAQPTDVSGNPFQVTPAPIYSEYFDADSFNGRVATLGALMNSTPIGISDVSGSYAPTDLEALAAQGGDFFSMVRGISGSHVGVFTVFLVFIIGRFVLALISKLALVVIPLTIALFGFVRRVVQLILDFIPL